MNEQKSCPGCPECKPAGSNVPISDDNPRNPLTKDEFGRLIVSAYVRYLRLPDHERETFDAASYVAGLEHGYREGGAHPDSAIQDSKIVARCLFAFILVFLVGLLLGVAIL